MLLNYASCGDQEAYRRRVSLTDLFGENREKNRNSLQAFNTLSHQHIVEKGRMLSNYAPLRGIEAY